MSNNKRQQTMAKIQRERAVKEKRERKLEKKQLRAEERKARAAGLPLPGDELAEGDDLPAEDDVPRGEDLPAGEVSRRLRAGRSLSRLRRALRSASSR